MLAMSHAPHSSRPVPDVRLYQLLECLVLQAELRHSSQLSALDAQYQSKMMAEVERYQQLLQEKEALNER
jgi:hypothetical protein